MQLHLYISGRVQGVGYRRYVQRKATTLGVGGWVRNLPDRRVEAVVQGDENAVEKLLKLCKKGPFLADVTVIQKAEEEETEQFFEFAILPMP